MVLRYFLAKQDRLGEEQHIKDIWGLELATVPAVALLVVVAIATS